MNVLEKILEEIENERKSLVDMSDDEPEFCDVTDWIDEGIREGRIKACLQIEEIIRSHMDEVPDNNAGWIPVSEKLPEEGQDVLAQFVVRIVSVNNEVREAVYIHVLYCENGAWQSFAGVPNGKVEAWQPLPELYREEVDEKRG